MSVKNRAGAESSGIKSPVSHSPRKIGILGGMGPEATALLFKRIIAATPAQDDSDHIPLLIDNDPQVPSRIAALIENRAAPDPGVYLAGMAKRLENAGCAALAMPCNTAHVYAPAILQAIDIPLLDMVEATAEDIAAAFPASMESRPVRVGMLASPAIQKTGVFNQAFGRKNLCPVFPGREEDILKIIKAIKSGAAASDQYPAFMDIVESLQGVEVLLIACSELSLFTEHMNQSLPCFDSMDSLTDRIIRFSQEDRLIQKQG